MVEKVFIENLRKNALGVRFEERKNLVISRKRKLQEIYAACRHIDRTKPFPSADIVQKWGTIENYEGANMEEGEKKFLEENDLEKGRLFSESTLPLHSSYLPEPGGFPKLPTFKAGSLASSKQSQHVMLQPAVGRPPQALEVPTIAQEADLPANKGLRHASVDRKKSGDISLAEPVTTNGNRMGEGMDVPMIDKPGAGSGTEEDLRPLSGTAESAPEEVRLEPAVVDVGGVPVLQDSAARVPDEKERSRGVHLPLIPAELVNKLLDDLSVIAEAPSKSGPENSVETPEPISKSPVAGPSGDSAGEIPDSYESSQSSSLSDAPTSPSSPKGTVLELRQEPRLTAISSQDPPQSPHAVNTTEENHPLPIPLLQPSPKKSLPHQEVSSPTSSIDGGDTQSTPGNVISSATSPDASHIPDLESRLEGDTKGLILDSGPYGSAPLPVKEVEKGELAGVLVGKDMASRGAQSEKPLSPVMAAGGVVGSEEETQSKLPVIPSTELAGAGGQEAAAAVAIPVSEMELESIKLASPRSPDPSAQLRLENSLVRRGIEGVGMPATAVGRPTPENALAAKSHDEEVEDQVQLVGISRPELEPRSSEGLVELVKEAVGEMAEEMEVDDPAPTAERGPGVATRSEGVRMSGTGQPPSPEHAPPPTWSVIPTPPLATPKQETLGLSISQQIGRLTAEVEQAAGEGIPKLGESLTAGPLPLPLPPLPSRGEGGAGLSRDNGTMAVPPTTESGPTPSGDGVKGGIGGVLPVPLIPSISPPGGIPRHHRELERKRAKLSKVVISSTHHALAAAEEEAKRLQEDQISQGIIVVARRRDQQAASAAARGRSAVFQPGSKIDAITRYGIADPPSIQKEKKKSSDSFDVLHTYKASGTSVADLLQRSSKTLTTSDHQVHYFESQAVRIESRIQDLQDQGLWSLRQIPRVVEPRRRKCHWDYLLEEAKWLRDDFKGERRWKLAQARYLSKIVLQWYHAGEDRGAYTVDRKRYGVVPRGLREERKSKATADVEMADQPTPDLVDGGASPESDGDFPADDDIQDEGCFSESLFGHINDPPAAIFTLSSEEAVFVMPHTKAADDLLGQMPLYAPPQPPTERPEEIEEEWTKSPIVAVTKYATGRIQLEEEQWSPPRKRSRYEYDENYDLFADDSDEDERLSGGRLIGGNGRDKTRKPLSLPPEQTNVALFRPEYKPILQRLHNTHVPRTPSEFPPPSFFESRTPSLWLATEDEMLKTLVREYHYNWGLISQCLTLEGMWHSGSERRSPWECFERWISLEQVPQEFLKSPFFKPIQQRLDVAAKVSGLYGNLSNSAGTGMVKRRGTAPIRVEKRRVSKYYSVFESMRKLAKKRETSVNKQQTNKSQVIAAIKRASENPSNSTSQLKTPQYFSSIKYEREQKQQEQQKSMYSQPVQGIPQPRGSQVLPPQARVPPHPGQHPGLPNGVPIAPQQRVSLPVPQVANGLPQVGRAGPMSNGTNGIPVRALPTQVAQARYTPDQLAQYRFRLAQQAQLAQQQQQAGYQVSPTSQIGSVQVPQAVAPNMQAMLHQAQQAALGQAQPQPKPRIVPPPLDPQAQASALSPRMPPTPTTATNPQPKPQHLAHVSVQEMAALVQFQNPGLPQEQIQKAAQQTLANYHAQLSQNMQARTPNRPGSGRTAVNTGPMIGVNGPVNPMNEGSPRIGQMASPRITPTAPNQPQQPST